MDTGTKRWWRYMHLRLLLALQEFFQNCVMLPHSLFCLAVFLTNMIFLEDNHE